MAIPIAEGSINKQFQAPRAAQGKPVDLSQNIQQIGQQTINALQGIQQFTNAQEEMTANDAITLYSTQMNNLNLELRSKKGLDAVNFESEYKKKASKYHSEFINRLGGLNSNVQNSTVNKINQLNLNNKNEFIMYTEGQRIFAEKESSDAAKQALSSAHLAQFDNTFADNKAVFYDATAALDEMVLKDCLREGMASDPTYVKTRQEEERVVFAGQVVQKFNRQGDYRRSMQFLEDIKGQIPEPSRVALGHDASFNQLKVEVLSDPEKFKNKKFTDWYVTDKYFPYLEELERKQLLASLQKTNSEKSDLNADQKKTLADINSMMESEAAEIFYNLGIVDLMPEFSKLYSEESKALKANVKNDENIYNVTALQDAIDQLTLFTNSKVGLDFNGEIVRDEKGNYKIYKDAEAEEADLKKGVIITSKASSETLNKAKAILEKEIHRLDMEGKYGNVTDRQAFFKGKDPTVKEILDFNIGRMLTDFGDAPWWREILFNEKDKISPASTYSSLRYTVRQAADEWLKKNELSIDVTGSKLNQYQRRELSAVVANAILDTAPEGLLKEYGIDKNIVTNVEDITASSRKKLAEDFFQTQEDFAALKSAGKYLFGSLQNVVSPGIGTLQQAEGAAELAAMAYENRDMVELAVVETHLKVEDIANKAYSALPEEDKQMLKDLFFSKAYFKEGLKNVYKTNKEALDSLYNGYKSIKNTKNSMEDMYEDIGNYLYDSLAETRVLYDNAEETYRNYLNLQRLRKMSPNKTLKQDL